MREQHFPGRAPIDAYGNGGFRFADMSHRGSILCLPSGIYGWPVEEGAALTLDDFARVMAEAADIEVLLVGTGTSMQLLSRDLRTAFRDGGVADSMSTGAAVRTFNILLAENRAAAAALIAVEE